MAEPAAPPFENLADALAWLDAHIDFEQNMPRRRAWPTLDRIHALTALLGEPQDSIPSIHVTGTNGKGSTSAMATALLLSKGLSVGTYTSPNLHTVSERIARNAEPIDDDSFTTVLTELALLEPLLPERPTRFDLLTAAAFSWFASEAVDTMVVEVGLGGTWDTTNVIHGAVAVVTNVSFDHTDVLGPTLEGIAADKAGIIEPGSAVVLGDLREDLLAIVEARAAEVGAASVWVYGQDFGVETNQVAVGGRLVTLWTPGGRYEDVLVPLHGAHQGVNAAVALAAVEAFFGEPLTLEVVEEGFAAVRVPGRLEVLGRRPLLLVDGAHNAAGMATLGDALERGVRGRWHQGGGHRHALGSRSLRDDGAPGLGRSGGRGPLSAGHAARHAVGRHGRGGARTRAGGARGTRRARRAALGPRHGRRRRARRGLRFPLRGGRRREPTRCRPPCPGRKPAADRGGAGLCNLDSSWTAPLSL